MEVYGVKKEVKIFVSYAHRNEESVKTFTDEFREYIRPSKKYNYTIWHDEKLICGEKWNEAIMKEVNECDLGLLMLSASFLNSKYISENELPALLKNKLVFPIMIQNVDFSRHDLKGIEKIQVYSLKGKPYWPLGRKQQAKFIEGAFVKMEELLNKHIK